MSPDASVPAVTHHCGVYVDWLNIKMSGAGDIGFDVIFNYIRGEGGVVRVANFYTPFPP